MTMVFIRCLREFNPNFYYEKLNTVSLIFSTFDEIDLWILDKKVNLCDVIVLYSDIDLVYHNKHKKTNIRIYNGDSVKCNMVDISSAKYMDCELKFYVELKSKNELMKWKLSN